MASSSDFTLYPYSETWDQEQTYLPTTTYPDQPFLAAPSFDSYHQHQSFAQHQQQFHYTEDQLKAPEHSPNFSPASSTSHSFDHNNNHHFSSISDSGASAQSTISSAVGSPSMQPQPSDWRQQSFPSIVHHDGFFAGNHFESEVIPVLDKGCVGKFASMQLCRGNKDESWLTDCKDPSLIQPYSPSYMGTQFQELQAIDSPSHTAYPMAASPDPTRTPIHRPRTMTGKSQRSTSPYSQQRQSWQPHSQYTASRRQSASSVQSKHSHNSLSSEDSNKGLCPIAACGRHVKDLKAHMLTHQHERPEKCSVVSCEYHIKGFARKYDKNRHTLTHYKGTMVCGFCPGSGSAAEKSFNRADVFKRHLTSVHGVEQAPPNARRRSPASSGKKTFGATREASGLCSTCNNAFANAQDFYEHLDDCVLRVVQRTDPSEAINEKLLLSVAADKDVHASLERHMLPTNVDHAVPENSLDDEEMEEEMTEEIDQDDANDGTYGTRSGKAGRGSLKARRNEACVRAGGGTHVSASGAICKPNRKGFTLSKDGVALGRPMNGKGAKRRKDYPLSWGAAPSVMKMKKRVLCVFDGQRRLLKDDMMLDNDHEVRIPLQDTDNGPAWATDLDVQTLRRSEGMLNATEEEKGPWTHDDEALEKLMM